MNVCSGNVIHEARPATTTQGISSEWHHYYQQLQDLMVASIQIRLDD